VGLRRSLKISANHDSCIAIVLLTFAYWSDRIQKRSPFILAGLLMCLTGFSINISTAPSGSLHSSVGLMRVFMKG
jgi:hypothetical protein